MPKFFVVLDVAEHHRYCYEVEASTIEKAISAVHCARKGFNPDCRLKKLVNPDSKYQTSIAIEARQLDREVVT